LRYQFGIHFHNLSPHTGIDRNLFVMGGDDAVVVLVVFIVAFGVVIV
jgi:hypothetical protein